MTKSCCIIWSSWSGFPFPWSKGLVGYRKGPYFLGNKFLVIMSNAVKVVFLSTIEDQSELKWSATKRRPLTGDEIAHQLEELIAEQRHRGYRFVQMNEVHTRTSDSTHDMSHMHPKPDGLLVVFEQE